MFSLTGTVCMKAPDNEHGLGVQSASAVPNPYTTQCLLSPRVPNLLARRQSAQSSPRVGPSFLSTSSLHLSSPQSPVICAPKRALSRSPHRSLVHTSFGGRPGVMGSPELFCSSQSPDHVLVRRTRTSALRDLGQLVPIVPAQVALEAQDVVATGLAFLLALLWVRLWDELVHRGVIDSKLSRKLVHITTGLLFMLTWPFFSTGLEARFFAAAVPAANILRLSLLGLGITKNEAVVKAVSREGNPRELLRGPLFYVVTIALVTIVFWRTSPIGSIALAMMCGGDGIADIVGRRWGGERLPWNRNKSWAGSIAMFSFGSLLSMLFVYLFCQLGFYNCSWWSLRSCATIAFISLGATLVESMPISTRLDDNFTVPLTAIVLGLLLLPAV